MDEIRIWNYARTSPDILSYYLAKLAGTESGLMGYWNFDDANADDLTTNGNNGVLYGGASMMSDPLVTNSIYTAIEVPFISGSPMTSYQLQYTTDLEPTNWLNAGNTIRGSGKEMSFFDGPRGAPLRYYRIIMNY
jgi:hypothetical protein